ncbi:MAG: CMP/dCMP kinase [Chloroflexota bacterium]|nr:CMP/dCMP kinase [Chloroflexota bacterium]
MVDGLPVQGVRIQKALADAGVASRRAAETLVADGRVTVNGLPAQIGQRVEPGRDRIAVDGRALAAPPRRMYLAMNKPVGVTSTVSDRHASETVVGLVPDDLRQAAGRIYPVGRLDRDSEGLLLLTNDGEWAQRLLHPSYGVDREYAVGLAAPLDAGQARALEVGVDMEEGRARLLDLRPASAAEVARLRGTTVGPPLQWYRVVLGQGWRRQVRRMFAAVGAPVSRLVRVRIGPLRLAGLALGDVRELTATERRSLEGTAPSPAPGSAGPPRGLVVSLDGPGSSGKSSVGAGAARELGYRFCDTGVLYRGLTWLALERGVNPEDADALLALIPEMVVVPDETGHVRRIRVGERDVTDELQSPEVEGAVSLVARQEPVRRALLPLQRDLARDGGIIMAGRDIGTVVLPDADLKLYLDVSVEERARRRAAERRGTRSAKAREIEAELRRRDELDSTRTTAPLRIPEGATLIGGDENRFEDTVREVVRLVRDREARRPRDGERPRGGERPRDEEPRPRDEKRPRVDQPRPRPTGKRPGGRAPAP